MLPKLINKSLSILLVFGIFMLLPVKVFAGNAANKTNSHYYLPSGWAASDGSSTETVSFNLRDVDNNPVVGNVVNLSSSNDSTAVFSNPQTTDGSGNVSFTITSKTSGTTNITLTDSTNSVAFTDWFSVKFNPPGFGCTNIPTAPVLTSVVSNSNNTATLIWTDSADPVSNYLISYGIASKNYIYGNTNVGSQGTTSFTVGALTGGKKYYFVVAANNNCGTSGFSNELTVVANPVPATPAPTTLPTIAATATPKVPTFVVSATPPDIPQSTDTPAPAPPTQDVNANFRNLGIGVVVAGILLIGSVLLFQKTKNRN